MKHGSCSAKHAKWCHRHITFLHVQGRVWIRSPQKREEKGQTLQLNVTRMPTSHLNETVTELTSCRVCRSTKQNETKEMSWWAFNFRFVDSICSTMPSFRLSPPLTIHPYPFSPCHASATYFSYDQSRVLQVTGRRQRVITAPGYIL